MFISKNPKQPSKALFWVFNYKIFTIRAQSSLSVKLPSKLRMAGTPV